MHSPRCAWSTNDVVANAASAERKWWMYGIKTWSAWILKSVNEPWLEHHFCWTSWHYPMLWSWWHNVRWTQTAVVQRKSQTTPGTRLQVGITVWQFSLTADGPEAQSPPIICKAPTANRQRRWESYPTRWSTATLDSVATSREKTIIFNQLHIVNHSWSGLSQEKYTFNHPH